MTQPLPLDTVLSEFSETSQAWVLQSKRQAPTSSSGHADSFVVHSPNEVFEFLNERS